MMYLKKNTVHKTIINNYDKKNVSQKKVERKKSLQNKCASIES